MKCSFAGCDNDGRLQKYSCSIPGSSRAPFLALTKKPWCDEHATTKQREEAKRLHREAKMADAGIAPDAVKINSSFAAQLGRLGYSADKLVLNKHSRQWYILPEELQRYQDDVAERSKESAKRRSEDFAELARKTREKYQPKREKGNRQKMEAKPAKHGSGDDLSDEVVTVSCRAAAGEHGTIAPPGAGYKPWGGPMLAVIDGEPHVVQAFRRRLSAATRNETTPDTPTDSELYGRTK